MTINADPSTRSFTTNGGRTYEVDSRQISQSALDKLQALSESGSLDNSDVVNILRSFPSSYRLVAAPGMPKPGEVKSEDPPFDGMSLDLTSFFMSQMDTNRKLEFAMRQQALAEKRERLRFEKEEQKTAKDAAEKHYDAAKLSAGMAMGGAAFTIGGAGFAGNALRKGMKAGKASDAANLQSAPLKDAQAKGQKGLQKELADIDLRRSKAAEHKDAAEYQYGREQPLRALEIKRDRTHALAQGRMENGALQAKDAQRLGELDLKIAQQKQRQEVIKNADEIGPKLDAEVDFALGGRSREIARYDEIAAQSHRQSQQHNDNARAITPFANALQTLTSESGKIAGAGATLDAQLADADAKFDGALAGQAGMSMEISKEGYNALSSANSDLASSIRAQTEEQKSFGSRVTSF